jgi:hypothetical protein
LRSGRSPWSPFSWIALVASTSLHLGTACAAVYPEVSTPVKPVPAGRELVPPPPTDVLYIAIVQVEIPNRTRDGRHWDGAVGGLPDPYAKVFLNDKELFHTPTQSDTLKPVWPDAPKTNYDVPKNAVLSIELWDDNPVHSVPICAQEFRDLHTAAVEDGELVATCDGGARIRIDLKPAQAKFGLGFYYELRAESVAITRVMPLSPASRAGLKGGEEIVQVMARPVKRMTSAELRSLINAHAPQGLKMRVRSGIDERELEIKEGPIYIKGEK